MLTLIPDLHTKNKFYQENTLISLSARLQEENVDNQLLLLDDETDQFLANYMDTKQVIYLFDKIRGIEIDGSPLTLKDLHIPDDYKLETLIYLSGTQVEVFDDQTRVMEVILGSSGELKLVSYYEKTGQIVDSYDLRGFRSSRSYFNELGQLTSKEWFNATSDLVMTQNEDLTITIPARQQPRFQKSRYTNLAEIECEFALPYLTGKQKLLIEPSQESLDFRHFLLQAQVYYYFTEYDQIVNLDYHTVTPQDQYLFQNETLAHLFFDELKQNEVDFVPLWHIIPPYFNDFSLGTSMEREEQLIYWHVGQIDNNELMKCFCELIDLLKENKNLRIMADADLQYASFFKAVSAGWVAEFKDELNEIDEVESLDEVDTTNLDVDQIEALDRFACPENATYEQKLAVLRQAHIFIDTDPVTNYDLQLEAVKIGIPQIVYQSNNLIKEGKNGFLIKQKGEIKEPVEVFLTNLDKWNVAVVENVRLIQRMSLRMVIKQWKRVLQG
ncbi:accessory Sec system glycosyltransferase Asp1 [Lactobacillus sp. ESL0701]|nr:accessory Sec system glycosyltransferase Asp1 [Lactobacillus sp. ESL0701]